jgi:acyl-CoA synthetase (AMP-forming)/AMP-acid ligase II
VYVPDPPQPPLGRGEPEFQDPHQTTLQPFKVPLPKGDLGGSLPSYKRPKHWIAVAQLPRNAQGKIDRTQLQRLIQTQIIQKI